MKRLKIALIGKPNVGKSSIFNNLTGLKQKIGNFPGVTVDKRIGFCQLNHDVSAEIIDLPGIYSIYPRTMDEKIVSETLTDKNGKDYPDIVALIADATNLKNCMLLLTQIVDLGIPVVLLINMIDVAAKSGLSLDINKLSVLLDIPVVMVNARQGYGMKNLKAILATHSGHSNKNFFPEMKEIEPALTEIQKRFNLSHQYEAFQYLQQSENLNFLTATEKEFVKSVAEKYQFFPHKYQGAETIHRYGFIQTILDSVVMKLLRPDWDSMNRKLDRILTHRFWGYLIFLALLFLIFQTVFAFAEIPMDLLDRGFTELSIFLNNKLPEGPFFELIANGIIPGVGGIVIFIPQIAILFAFISILEETGYMSRTVFLMDKLMRTVGMSGRSVVPLMSGFACAIPAIMATRNIENWKDRLITIFVIPLVSCSARLPIFTILVALIIPNKQVFGLINLQGLVLMGFYTLGFISALISALILKIILKSKERSYLIMEMPSYRMPKWSNVGFNIIEKTKTFVWEAGKVIIAISIILWVLASYGPAKEINESREVVKAELNGQIISDQEFENRVASYKLEHSYAGHLGKWMEPAIRPLGFDWKIGIALITSIAAREIFVGTIATIYSIGSADDNFTIKERLKAEINPETGGPRYTTAVGISLLVFYTFAMQCMSTLAVVKRETKGWKWPMLQLAYMTLLAYFSSWFIFQMLN